MEWATHPTQTTRPAISTTPFDFGPSLPDTCSPALKLFGSSYSAKVAENSQTEAEITIPAGTLLSHIHVGFTTNLSPEDASSQLNQIKFPLDANYWFVSTYPIWRAVPGQSNKSYTLAKHLITDASGNIVTKPVKLASDLKLKTDYINTHTPVAVNFFLPDGDTTPVHMGWGYTEEGGSGSGAPSSPPSNPTRSSANNGTVSGTVPAGGATQAFAWWLSNPGLNPPGTSYVSVYLNGKLPNPQPTLSVSPTSSSTCTQAGAYCAYLYTFTFPSALAAGTVVSVSASNLGTPVPWWDASGVTFPASGAPTLTGRPVGPATRTQPTAYDAQAPFCDVFTGNASPRTESLDSCQCTAPNCVCRYNSEEPSTAGLYGGGPYFFTQDPVREGVLTAIPSGKAVACTTDANCPPTQFCCRGSAGSGQCYSALTHYCTPEGVVRTNTGDPCSSQSDCTEGQVCCLGHNGAGLCYDPDFLNCSLTGSGAADLSPVPYFYQPTPIGADRGYGVHTTTFSNSPDQDVDYPMCGASDSFYNCCTLAVTQGVANRDGTPQAPRCPVGTSPGFITSNIAAYCHLTKDESLPQGKYTGTAVFGCFSPTNCTQDSQCASKKCTGGLCECRGQSDCPSKFSCSFGFCEPDQDAGFMPFREGRARLLPFGDNADVALSVTNCFSSVPNTNYGWTASNAVLAPNYIPDNSTSLGYKYWKGVALTDTLSVPIQYGDYYLSKSSGAGSAIGKVLLPDMVQCFSPVGCESDRARNIFIGGSCMGKRLAGVEGGYVTAWSPPSQAGMYYIMQPNA